MSEVPIRTYKSERLAQFREDMEEQAKYVYIALFDALRQKETVFDMKDFSQI